MTPLRVADAAAARIFEQASSLQRSGNFPAALQLLDRLVDTYPSIAALHIQRGTIYWSNHDLQRAIESFDKAIELDPDNAAIHIQKGTIYWSNHEFQRAIESFDRAIELDPGNAEAFFSKGSACQSLGDEEAAMMNYDRALSITPSHVEALNNKAFLLRAAGRIEAAIENYEAAVHAQPDCGPAWVGKSLCELLLGNYEQGWRSYDWRKQQFGPWGKRSEAPEWCGQDIAGKTLLLQAEQGLGDTIQFCRYAKLAKAAGASVVLQVQDRLTRMLGSLDPNIAILRGSSSAPASDYRIMLLSMPLVYRTTQFTIPNEKAYLKADEQLVVRWKERIGKNGFKIGIHWQGEKKLEGIDKYNDKERSFPAHLFSGISAIPGVRLISLQKNDGLEQLNRLPDGVRVEVPGFGFDDGSDAFIDSAAIIANLDLVITSDSSLAHLAGALGQPVWLALQYIPDWRWLVGRRDTPWYPSMRLFRQISRGNWPSVFDEMEQELKRTVIKNG